MNTSTLQILKLDPEAKLPVRQTAGSAGYDLYSLKAGIIEPLSRLLIPTGLAIKLPKGTYGRIASRSGLSVKKGIEVGAGVIDSDYFPKPVGLVLYNHGNEPFVIEKHMRIAQIIVTQILTPEIKEIVKLINEKKSERTGGFGSTGLTD